MAASPVAFTNAIALVMAFSVRVSPVSSTSGTCDGRGTSSMSVRIAAISSALSGLAVARTKRTRLRRRLRAPRRRLGEGGRLGVEDLSDPVLGQAQQVVELALGVRLSLVGALHLDEAAVARHEHVHVLIGPHVLGGVEVELVQVLV